MYIVQLFRPRKDQKLFAIWKPLLVAMAYLKMNIYLCEKMKKKTILDLSTNFTDFFFSCFIY